MKDNHMATNRYIDTRTRCNKPVAFTEAVVQGLADGGGLFVPERLPHFTLEDIIAFSNLSYAERAAKFIKHLIPILMMKLSLHS